jgi:hypothetical protein
MSKAKGERKEWYVPPISFERLHSLLRLLESGADIDDALRKEIIDALDCLFITFVIEKEQSTPGRRRSSVMQSAAYMVHCLVERHDAYVSSAVDAVLVRNASPQVVEALKKTYSTMKAAGGFGQYIGVDEEGLARAAARLPATRRKKKGGNK